MDGLPADGCPLALDPRWRRTPVVQRSLACRTVPATAVALHPSCTCNCSGYGGGGVSGGGGDASKVSASERASIVALVIILVTLTDVGGISVAKRQQR